MQYKNILWKLLHCREQITFKSSVSRVGSFLLPGFDNIYILVCFKSFRWNSVFSPASARHYRLGQTLHLSSHSGPLSRIAASAICMNTVNSSHSQKCKLPVCFKSLYQTQNLSFLALFHHSGNCSTCLFSFCFQIFHMHTRWQEAQLEVLLFLAQIFLEVWLFL